MGKNRLVLHSAAIVAILFFAFLAISSGASTPAVVGSTETTASSSQTTSRGVVHNMPEPEQKPFDALGLVFATSVTQFDENGAEASSQDGIVIMLLKEAQKIGGNDILNLRIDEKVTYTRTQVKSGSSTKTISKKTITYTGSAMAIKYR